MTEASGRTYSPAGSTRQTNNQFMTGMVSEVTLMIVIRIGSRADDKGMSQMLL